MELKPSQPPGRATRKLRGLVSEIARLKGEGYTNAAIQEALAATGVNVGLSTVQREVARFGRGPAEAAIRPRPPDPPTSPPALFSKPDESQPAPRPTIGDELLGKYFDKPPPNPLFKKASKK